MQMTWRELKLRRTVLAARTELERRDVAATAVWLSPPVLIGEFLLNDPGSRLLLGIPRVLVTAGRWVFNHWMTVQQQKRKS